MLVRSDLVAGFPQIGVCYKNSPGQICSLIYRKGSSVGVFNRTCSIQMLLLPHNITVCEKYNFFLHFISHFN